MGCTPVEMRQRTKAFALRVIRLVRSLPDEYVSRRIGDQLLRSATSVGANYRAACRARSRSEFRSKLGIVEEEGDESIYWMEMLIESGLVAQDRVANLMEEANQIVAIIVASINTAGKSRSDDSTRSQPR
jgi:four helix bundle protein